MGKTRIKPKLTKDFISKVNYWDGEKYVTRNVAFSKNIKDNSIWGRNGCVGGGWVTRIPSIKRNNRVWRNFYKLFPRMYDMVLRVKDKAIDGIVTITSDELGSVTNKMGKVDGFMKPSHLGMRTIKFKLL